jgi:putative phosphotransacetylase
MTSESPAAPCRASVEALVRQALAQQLGTRAPQGSAPVLLVNSSARHMHISPENLETLFGKGAELTVHKWLYQEGQFASQQTVTMIGPRKRIIPNLRILGPCRNLTQVELSLTDSISLGINIPVRASGDIKDTPGCYIMGPKGMIEMKNGVIRAWRHAHMSPADAAFYGVKHLDKVTLKVTAKDCTTRFDDVLVRVDPSFKLEVHIDTDEANACNLDHADKVELFKN